MCIRDRTLYRAEPFLSVGVEEIPAAIKNRANSSKTEALIRQTYSLLERYTELSDRVTPETYLKVLASDDPDYIADHVAQNLPLRYEDKPVSYTHLIMTSMLPAGRRI